MTSEMPNADQKPKIPQLKPTRSHRRGVRELLRKGRSAALATHHQSGHDKPWPLASLVTYATNFDGTPILLLSTLAEHTQALMENPACSLLIDQASMLENPQTGPRVTVCGTMRRCEDATERQRLQERFLAIHPGAELYAGFGDFAFWTLAVDQVHYVGGFARAVWINDEIIANPALNQSFGDTGKTIIADVNNRFSKQICHLASAEFDLSDGETHGWTLRSLDPDGMTFGKDDSKRTFFVCFDDAMTSPDGCLEKVTGMLDPAAKTTEI